MTQNIQDLDLWTQAEAYRMESAYYDPLRGMSIEQAAGMPTQHFPAEAYTDPDWLTRLWQPVDYLWETGEQFVEHTAEKLPELLWGYGSQTLRKVDEGAGVQVVHTQAPAAGGAPAQPTQVIIPGWAPRTPVAEPPPAGKISASILVIVGVIVLVLWLKK